MYIPRNWEFGSALSKLRNFGEVMNLPNPPSVRHSWSLPCLRFPQEVKRSGRNAEHPAPSIKRLKRTQSRFRIHKEVLGFAAGYNVGILRVFSCQPVLAMTGFYFVVRFTLCSKLAQTAVNCELTNKWIGVGKFRIYLHNGLVGLRKHVQSW
jgi:hypothetical protein